MKKLALLTSGGDSPGMNACIRGIVRAAYANNVSSYGVYRGYDGLINNAIEELSVASVANIINKGGTILKSARSEDFRTKEGRKRAYENLKKHDIEHLIVIGGDGSFTGATIFSEEYNIKTIGIPGTIDNDIYGTEYTIGFDTALNTVVHAVDMIRDTAESHERVFIVEVMGRDSGFLALRSGIAVGAQAVLIPEMKETEKILFDSIQKGIDRNKGYMIIIVAENGPTGGNSFEVMKQLEKKFPNLKLRVSILGHMQRGGNPTCYDRVSSSRLGVEAVKALQEEKNRIMIGLKHAEIVHIPIEDAIKKEKKLNPDILELLNVLNG